ncbi:MAG: M1 family aminopeptidase, partial [Candidatus Latescibacteria bacterium]|nr:M1 family aminopeptidase [Candidatus Latescibacterota bacterium]
GTKTYRIAYVEVHGSTISGESKGNAMYFAYRGAGPQWNEQAKLSFMQLISHELFHNWNLWSIQWNGKLYEWFVEGGAGFMSAWACENILGREAGGNIRLGFAEGYSKRGNNAIRTLENAQKTGDAERALIYSYGALVWEQLRQKLGDEAFFSGLADFFNTSRYQSTGYRDLFASLQAHTKVSVGQYLNQWVKNNAKIDLSISDVRVQQSGNTYETTVKFNVESERDYEIFTALAYKTSVTGEMTYVEVHTTQKGIQSLSFSSDQSPIFIQLDPDFRVPQIELNNDSWSG